MNCTTPQTQQTITNPQAAKTLLNPDWARLFKPFMHQACTIQEAAAYLKLEPAQLYYPVRRFLKLGLLKLVLESRRKGRAIKHYQASARVFFIPFHITTLASVEEFITQAESVWSQQLIKAQAQMYTEAAQENGWSLEMKYEDGFIWHTLLPESKDYLATQPSPQTVIASWETNYYLSEADVQQLSEEVQAVLERYKPKQSGSRRVVRFAIAPWRP